MTYNVFSGTLNLTQSINQTQCCDPVPPDIFPEFTVHAKHTMLLIAETNPASSYSNDIIMKYRRLPGRRGSRHYSLWGCWSQEPWWRSAREDNWRCCTAQIVRRQHRYRLPQLSSCSCLLTAWLLSTAYSDIDLTQLWVAQIVLLMLCGVRLVI